MVIHSVKKDVERTRIFTLRFRFPACFWTVSNYVKNFVCMKRYISVKTISGGSEKLLPA